MRRIAETINAVPIPTAGPDWHRRIVLGCWSGRYLPMRARHLPRYAVTLICVHLGYARQFLQEPGISFSVNQMVLVGGGFGMESMGLSRTIRVGFGGCVRSGR